MKSSMLAKLEHLLDRHQELSALLSDADTIGDQERFRNLSREYAEIGDVVACYGSWRQIQEDIATARDMLGESDAELRAMAEEEIAAGATQLEELEVRLQRLLLPRDPDDRRNIFLEVRAGAGGDEAAIFAGDLFRMYSRYAERCGWRVEVVSASDGEHGGYKEVIARIEGQDVYGRLKFESGGHRVQRVPKTESQGRIHTSACTVAVMPEVDEVEAVDINKADLRVDTYRASGAGGQHVNRTDSAVRITHLPSGLVVECQDERSQHKNRARAMSLLASKLLQMARSEREQAVAAERKSLVGSGDRSERIRTYNFPQGRITDHRINLTLYSLDEVMQGTLEPIIDALQQEHQAELLAALGDA